MWIVAAGQSLGYKADEKLEQFLEDMDEKTFPCCLMRMKSCVVRGKLNDYLVMNDYLIIIIALAIVIEVVIQLFFIGIIGIIRLPLVVVLFLVSMREISSMNHFCSRVKWIP